MKDKEQPLEAEYGASHILAQRISEYGGDRCLCKTSDGRIVNIVDELNRIEREKYGAR
jgi:hypothetical protein